MGTYDNFTREQLIERLEKVEERVNCRLRDILDGEGRIARTLMIMLQNYNGDYEEKIMRIVLERYQADRAFVFKFDWIAGRNSNLFEVNSENVTRKMQNLQNLPNEILEKYIESFRQGIPLIISDVEQMKEEGCVENKSLKSIFRLLELKSVILFPMKIFGQLWGYVGMGTSMDCRSWNSDDIEWLQAFADVLNLGISQKLIQKKATLNEQRFEKLFKNMSVGFVRHRLICDDNNCPVDYEFLEVNPAFEKLTGMKKQDCLGKTATQLNKGQLRKELLEQYKQVAFEGKQMQFDYYTPLFDKHFNSILYSSEKGEFISLFYDVTEQYKANKQIRQNEKKLRSIFDNLLVGIISYDENGCFLDTNDKMLEILKYKDKEQINKNEWLCESLKQKLGKFKILPFEYVYDPVKKCELREDGETMGDARYLTGKLIMHSNDKGECMGYLIIMMDNTEMYNAYRKIRVNEQIWTEVAGAARMFNWSYNIKTRQYTVSDEIIRYGNVADCATDREKLILDYVKHIAPQDRRLLIRKWKECLEGQVNVPFEITYEIKVGEKLFYSTSRWSKKTEEDSEVMYGITFDVSDLMYAEKALKENLVRLSLILESGEIYPWYLNMRTNRLDISEDFYKAFDRNKADYADYTMNDFVSQIHPDDLDEFAEMYEKLRAGLIDRLRIELRLNVFGDRYFWYELNAAVRKRGEYNEIIKLLGFLIVIQKRKDNETQLIEAMKKAEESDKLKSAFLANVSHEIRTPLNAIIGFSEIIAHSEEEDEKKMYLDIIKTNNNLLLNLINDILDLSKIESGRIDLKDSVVNVNELCRELCVIHQLKANKNVKIVFENAHEPLVIFTDKNRLHQLYSNLMGNSVKNTLSGSITIGYCVIGPGVAFWVKDTGKGIPKDKQTLIFNRFEKLNSNSPGFGLGLPICKSILERMGGEISFESEPGVGSEFTFTFPCRIVEDKAVKELSSVMNKNKGCARLPDDSTILVAEDIDCNYQLLEAILGKKYHLLRAVNGVEAVAFFTQKKPDIILMDMKMPELNGIDATRIIREVSADIPIIALTAFAYDSDKELALEAGCNDFLTKPVESKQLKALIEKYLTNGIYQ